MDQEMHAVDRRWLTDPRTSLAALALGLVAALAAGNVAVAGLAIGGLAGFSLSGSP
jgi:hypothetical protein